MLKIIKTLDLDTQRGLVKAIAKIVEQAPLFDKHMPRTGYKFNYKCTSCGDLGWFSDKEFGYRYESVHPITKEPFPEIPQEILEVVEEAKILANEPDFIPESCLINVYGPTNTLGIHQDKTEKNLKAMVLSVSLGASMEFHWCSKEQGYHGKKIITQINSGDILVMSGPDRLCWHGVPKPPIPNTTPPDIGITDGYRINLTIRQVN